MTELSLCFVKSMSCYIQVAMSNLESLSQQLVLDVVPSIVPADPYIPTADSLNNILLLPSLLFITAVIKKQSRGSKVCQQCA